MPASLGFSEISSLVAEVFGNDELAALSFENRHDFADAMARATGYVVQDQLLRDFIEAYNSQKPLLIEGERGGGKTEFVKSLAVFLHLPFFRVQCMEGIDRSEILFRWDREAQEHFVRHALASNKTLEEARSGIYDREFLIPGTILQAYLTSENNGYPSILLIDEIDKLPPKNEDMVLEVLDERMVSVPNLPEGRLGSTTCHPIVFLTSNAMRSDVSSPLRSRCCFTYLDKPTPEQEMDILKARVPHASDRLVRETVVLLQELRSSTVVRDKPGLREAIPFLESVVRQGGSRLNAQTMGRALTHLIKRLNDRSNISLKLDYFEDLIARLVPGVDRRTRANPVCRLTQAVPALEFLPLPSVERGLHP